MGSTADFSTRELKHSSILLHHSSMKKIAQKIGVSTQSVTSIKKKLETGHFLKSGRIGKCSRKKKKTIPRLDCKIKKNWL